MPDKQQIIFLSVWSIHIDVKFKFKWAPCILSSNPVLYWCNPPKKKSHLAKMHFSLGSLYPTPYTNVPFYDVSIYPFI